MCFSDKVLYQLLKDPSGPQDCFELYVTLETAELIRRETNQYARQFLASIYSSELRIRLIHSLSHTHTQRTHARAHTHTHTHTHTQRTHTRTRTRGWDN